MSIRDIVAIESQLTRRQADLDSLEQQQAFLEGPDLDVHGHREHPLTPDERAKKKEKDDDNAGFLSGLETGTKALVVFAVGLATVSARCSPALVLSWSAARSGCSSAGSAAATRSPHRLRAADIDDG